MENTLLNTLKEQQAEAIKFLKELGAELDAAQANYTLAKDGFNKQKVIVDQNARALKAFEPPKKRTRKTEK